MFGTLGGPELFLIFVVALIVFGPRKLPEIGRSLGKMMAEFRKASNEFRSTIESEVEAEKIRESMRIEPPKFDAPTASVAPASVAATPATVTPEPETAAKADHDLAAAPTPPAAGVPETVSRQPEPTPIEHK